MKLFCVILVICAVIIAVTSSTVEERIEMAKNCQKETKASDEDMEKYFDTNGVDDAPKVYKCLDACFLTEMGILDESNKLIPDKVDTLVFDDDTWMSKDGKSAKEIYKEIGETCKSETDEDRCEAAFKIASCMEVEGKKLGLYDD